MQVQTEMALVEALDWRVDAVTPARLSQPMPTLRNDFNYFLQVCVRESVCVCVCVCACV